MPYFSLLDCVLLIIRLVDLILEYNLKNISSISLFSGGGGLDLGFAAAGYDIQASIEIDQFSCNTLKINSGKRHYLGNGLVINDDIKNISSDILSNYLHCNLSNIDALMGGPPCQAFSVFGRRKGINDPRGNLIWEYLRILKEIQPKVFVFENVSGLKTIHNGELYKRLLEDLSCDGIYTVSDHNYNIANYGIPQFRNRIFFIGVKGKEQIPPMAITHGNQDNLSNLLPYVTAGKALKNMPDPNETHLLLNHIGRKHSKRIVDRYKSLSFGERDHCTRINKLDPNRPSFTIIVGSDKGGGKGHIHPYSPREVTPRESARIQTFPDWWEFYGNGRHVIRQVGNAVPPLFSALLAQHIRKHVFDEKQIIDYNYFVEKLELDYLR